MTSDSHATAGDQHLELTPLHEWHEERGARMGAFAGYDMPIRYGSGTIAEHTATRTTAGLFDVSHMGIAELRAPNGDFATVAAAVERLVPCDVASLGVGRQRYTQLLNDAGGIIDDLMISRTARRPEVLTVVSNAGSKAVVFADLEDSLPELVLSRRAERALIAIQGPAAEAALCEIADEPEMLRSMLFMHAVETSILGSPAHVTRSGYTGEDGFEIAIPPDIAAQVATTLCDRHGVNPAGLGARDTLRLEAGLCLYGNDLDPAVSPVEAGLTWSIQKSRRERLNCRGADRLRAELSGALTRRLVGLAPTGRTPVRDHTQLFVGDTPTPVGVVTSGGFGPTVGRPIAMGFVPPSLVAEGTELHAAVRSSMVPVAIAALPFVPHTYRRVAPN